ncbi:hypothetical protein QTO34_005944 [Cnephaeus nilssonii]|uniref:60S ribosomal protein L29 n=1 Tax=Cnephaeus nilssonii TaxID=3371016 RepID=A0AA40HLS3_CNENI|nr:hypothetical protein QTO34_005944 [Eptesicus nilssonii]
MVEPRPELGNAKHNKKILKKMQANNAKTMNACAKAVNSFTNPKEVKPKIPRATLLAVLNLWVANHCCRA